jgi:hypothetical protein
MEVTFTAKGYRPENVRFLTIRGVTMTERGTVEGVDADRLAAVFTEQTGFDTHM